MPEEIDNGPGSADEATAWGDNVVYHLPDGLEQRDASCSALSRFTIVRDDFGMPLSGRVSTDTMAVAVPFNNADSE